MVIVFSIVVQCHNYLIWQHLNVKIIQKLIVKIVLNLKMLVRIFFFAILFYWFIIFCLIGDYQIRTSAHAYPCSYLPSCKNRSDGLYPDRLRDCRMYFRCTSERSSESFSCSQTALPFGERFSLKEQRCLPAQYVECNNDENKPLWLKNDYVNKFPS